MSYRSNFGGVVETLARARQAGLLAAATPATEAIKKRLAKGYTTGDFVRGAEGIVGRVAVVGPVQEDGRQVVIITAVPKEGAAPYELYWELGHQNLFTGQYERVEVWRPALFETREEAAARYAEAYAAVLNGEAVRSSEAAD